ncbi:MAG: rubredoxin [Candidatus Alcyoniella australis]|nr:rubredoxin [Candidatus Alcyoniella australis]
MSERYECQVCGYLYDPVAADPANGIPLQTEFWELPEDWCCPVCSASRKSFDRLG